MVVVARIKHVDFLPLDEINERLPAIQGGLYLFFPLDGAGGTMDIIQFRQPVETCLSGVNLLELNIDWTDINNWSKYSGSWPAWDATYNAWKFTSVSYLYLNKNIKLIEIDPNKTYNMEIDVLYENNEGKTLYWGGDRLAANKGHLAGYPGTYDYSVVNGHQPTPLNQWITYKAIGKTGTSATVDGWGADGCKYYQVGGLVNFSNNNTQVTYIRKPKFYYTDADNSNCTYYNSGVAVEKATTNLWGTKTFGIYNNFNVPATLTVLPNETYRGQPIYRLTMTPQTDAQRDNFRNTLSSHGVCSNAPNFTFAANNTYHFSIYWRPISSRKMSVGGTASNIPGWTKVDTYDMGDGWYKSVCKWNSATDGSDRKFWSFIATACETLEPLTIDWCCPQAELLDHCTSYTYDNRAGDGSLTLPVGLGTTDFTVIGEWIPNTDSRWLTDNQKCISLISDTQSDIELSTYNNSGTYEPYLNGDVFDGTGHNIYEVFTTQPFIKVKFSIKRQGNTCWWHLVDENGQDTTWQLPKDPATDAGLTGWNFDKIHFSGEWGGIYSNIAVYNKVLTDDEINKVQNNTLSVTPAGKVITRPIIESVTETFDPYKALSWSKDSGNNLIPWDFTSFSGNGTNVIKDFFGTDITVRSMGNTDNYSCYSPYIVVNPEIPYVFSIWLWSAAKTAGSYYLGLNSSSSDPLVINESGVSSNNPYFWYDSYNNVPMGKWIQIRGYLLPLSYTSDDWQYLKNLWLKDYIVEGNRGVWRMPVDLVHIRLRFLDFYNNTNLSESYWALPTIAPLSPLRLQEDRTLLYHLDENTL